MQKKKVAYVAGVMDDWRHLAMFEDLRNFEVEVHAIGGDQLVSHYRSNLKLYLYEHVQDMPGYMRGLEDKIMDAALIISREASRLSTFQAVRIAQKFEIPSLVVVSETRPNFYKKFSNISAIQSDIFRSSSGFVCLSKHADAMLDFYDIPGNKKTIINPTTASFVPGNISGRRQRFRQQAALNSDDIVLGVFATLDASFRGELLFGALKMLQARNPYDAKKIKVLVVGDGSASQSLKYSALEMGVGEQVSFIHEDTGLYYNDLLAALDFVLHLEPIGDKLEFHEPFPRYLLDATALAAVPLVRLGSVAKAMLGDNCLSYAEDSEYHLSGLLQECLAGYSNLTVKSREFADNITELYSSRLSSMTLNAVMDSLLKEVGLTSNAERYSSLKDQIRGCVGRSEYDQALLRLEEGLLDFAGQGRYISSLLQQKGDIFMSLNRSDEALEAYAKSIEYDSKNVSVYISLGLISFSGHAFSDAITFYKKALGLSPENNEAMVGLGMSYFRNSMHNEAMYWLKKAVISEGGVGKALTALIQAATDCPKPDLGVCALESVLEATGECNRLLLALGRMYVKTGQADKGHFLVEKALAADSGVV